MRGVPVPGKEGAVRTEPPRASRWTETPVGAVGKMLILILFKMCSKVRRNMVP